MKLNHDLVENVQQFTGIYHLSGNGAVSRFNFAKAILKKDHKSWEQTIEDVLLAKTTDFPSPAKRPLYSALDCSRAERVFGIRIPTWEEMLNCAMKLNQN
jgi:dTDP-4-dehydrorhamnose reductase